MSQRGERRLSASMETFEIRWHMPTVGRVANNLEGVHRTESVTILATPVVLGLGSTDTSTADISARTTSVAGTQSPDM